MTFSRKTVAGDVTLEGRGLHSGTPVKVVVHPGRDGVRFMLGRSVVVASPCNVTDTSRCTKLGDISTVEHILSAMAGLEITDADIELTAPELPAFDGSALPYLTALGAAGFEVVGASVVEGPFARVFHHETHIAVAVSAGNGHWRYEFESGARWPHTQVFETRDVLADYASSLAPARTFGFEEEIPAILEAGMAQGLDLNSALVLGRTGYANKARFPDEPARHKLLDAVGDLSMAGVPIRFLNVVAQRSGHRANVHTAALLARSVRIVRT